MRPSTRLALGAGLVVLAACSADHPRPAPTTPAVTSVTTTRAPGTTTSTTATTSTGPATTVRPVTTTTRRPPMTATSARIVSFAGPPTPVRCLAHVQSIQLRWNVTGAVRVTLQIGEHEIGNSPVFATYAGGAQTQLEPLTCDGRPQSYLLTAYAANGGSVSRTLTLTVRGP